MAGRLRLWSGYVLFAYVTTHLLNHALGLVSLRVLEAGRLWFAFIWQGLPGQVALYGALLIHFSLALYALVRRRSLRLSAWEWTQYILGALIIPLAAATNAVGWLSRADVWRVNFTCAAKTQRGPFSSTPTRARGALQPRPSRARRRSPQPACTCRAG